MQRENQRVEAGALKGAHKRSTASMAIASAAGRSEGREKQHRTRSKPRYVSAGVRLPSSSSALCSACAAPWLRPSLPSEIPLFTNISTCGWLAAQDGNFVGRRCEKKMPLKLRGQCTEQRGAG
eukprot:1281963-Rhodomonas_salina.1